MDEVKFLRESPRLLNVVYLEAEIWWDAAKLALEHMAPVEILTKRVVLS